MQHEQDIKKILCFHNYDYRHIDFTVDLTNIIKQIECDLIYKSIGLESAEKIMCDLWRFEQSVTLNHLKTGQLKDTLIQFKQLKHYTAGDKYIICNKFIPCEAIKVSRMFHLLDQNQIKQLIDYGYGIHCFKLLIESEIRDIFCCGKHPNLSSSNIFCWDNNLRDIEFTVENVVLIEGMMSQFNLDSCFIELEERQLLLDVIRSTAENQHNSFSL
jgi:hypothetical protein